MATTSSSTKSVTDILKNRQAILEQKATLEITNEIGLHKDCIVEVKQGGVLILNGGSIYNATVIVRAGGEGHLENDGKIIGRLIALLLP